MRNFAVDFLNVNPRNMILSHINVRMNRDVHLNRFWAKHLHLRVNEFKDGFKEYYAKLSVNCFPRLTEDQRFGGTLYSS